MGSTWHAFVHTRVSGANPQGLLRSRRKRVNARSESSGKDVLASLLILVAEPPNAVAPAHVSWWFPGRDLRAPGIVEKKAIQGWVSCDWPDRVPINQDQ